MPRRGYGDSARGFNPGNRPINGSALKGRKPLTWINSTRIAPQNEFRVCLAALETHPENLFCDDGFPAWRYTNGIRFLVEKMMCTKTRASDWDIHNYIIFICYFHARSCAPLGRVAVRGTVPGVETPGLILQSLRGKNPSRPPPYLSAIRSVNNSDKSAWRRE